MRTSRTCRAAGLFAALALVIALAPASAQAISPCKEWPFTAPSKSVFHKAKIPALTTATTAFRYDGDVLRPKKVSRHARLPGIVLLHGRGGQKRSEEHTSELQSQ